MEPVLSAMLQNYNCEFSDRDIHRMELIVMQKLDFKLTHHTPYDFLKIVSHRYGMQWGASKISGIAGTGVVGYLKYFTAMAVNKLA